MRLYNIVPKSSLFSWEDKSKKRRPVPMTGVWLGSPGKDYRHSFTPIVVGPDEPHEAEWGIIPSRTLRPKISSNRDIHSGWIANLSSYTGDSHIVGHVLVPEDQLENFLVLDFGVGGTRENGTRYYEYLVLIPDECAFFVRNTLAPDFRLEFHNDKVDIYHVVSIPDGECVTLDDLRVRRWSRLSAKEIAEWSKNPLSE